jgi:Dockerin type I domain/EF hand
MTSQHHRLATATRFAALAVSATSALAFAGLAHSASKTYTLDADFDLGVLSGVNHDAPNNNQLQLNKVGTTFPVMWVANAGEDTVSKFDTTANVEIARYRTWFGPAGQAGAGSGAGYPHGAYSGPAPSRTAVDLQGNAYVLNRFFENKKPVLVKILAEGFIDRNGNGVADTSNSPTAFNMADLNNNGKIDPNEITDERIAWAVEVGSQNGLGRSLCIGTDGNLWVGMYNAQTYYKISSADGSQIAGPIALTPSPGKPNAGSWTPYGCLIDKNGTLWSASLGGNLGKIENTASNTGPYPVSSFADSFNYGIGIGNDKVYLGSSNRVFNPATNTFANSGLTVSGSGIVVDGAGNIITGSTTVQKVSSTGAVLWTQPLQAGGSNSVGVQVDSNNDVWQMGFVTAGRMQKYRGTDGTPLGTFPVGNSPYTYSDAAGFAARNSTSPSGTWTVVYDGGAAATPWGKIDWNDVVPAGGSVQVQARTADTVANLPSQTYQNVSKGAALAVSGRFIQILTRLNANLTNDSPILQDLTVSSKINACDVNGDGAIDSADIALIRAGIGQAPAANDPRDADGDGNITMLDVRQCILQCTRARCATAP